MRRAFVLFAVVCAVACGKSRVYEAPAGSSWDDPTTENGFYDLDRACSLACVPDADRAIQATHATRTNPPPRFVSAYDGMIAPVVAGPECLATAADGVSLDGFVMCTDPDDGQSSTRTRVGMPSAIAYTDRLFVADRDPNRVSHVYAGDELVASSETDVRTLVAHRGAAYWIDGNERIRRATEPGRVETLARVSRVDARFLAVDDAAFYFVRGGALVRRTRDRDESRTLVVARSPIRDMIVSGEWLYWTELGDARLRCNRDGSRPSCEARGRPIVHPSGALRRVRVAPPFDMQTLATDLDDASGILVVRSFAYVTTRDGVARIPLAGGSSPTILETGAPAFGRPALHTISWTLFVATHPDPAGRRSEIVAISP